MGKTGFQAIPKMFSVISDISVQTEINSVNFTRNLTAY